jgi:hypothetical protein
MALVFPYKRFSVPYSVWTLSGVRYRPKPALDITVIGPQSSAVVKALLDTGADDTVFHVDTARIIGVDLSNAPVGTLFGFGSPSAVTLRYAEVILRLTDGIEFREWPARVGFTQIPLRRALLGFAGVLQFFYSLFDGEQEQVELTINANYPGT